MEFQIVVLRFEFQVEESESLKVIGIEKARNERFTQDKITLDKSRGDDVSIKITGKNKKKKKYLRNLL